MNEIENIRLFSNRLIDAQKDIRILDAVHWDDEIRKRFLTAGGKKMPDIDKAYYQKRGLKFEPSAVLSEFVDLERGIKKKLGTAHPASSIMLRMCAEYRLVIDMLQSLGTPDFGARSRELFGSSGDVFHPGGPSLADISKKIAKALSRIELCIKANDPDDVANLSGVDAAVILQKQLNRSMTCHSWQPLVVVDDGIISDASAGADKIKLRQDALFSRRELRLLEVHEGWIHVGTTLNGHAQSVCRFLSKGTPSSTVTQEGLAVLTEIVSLSSSPARQQRINNRLLTVEMAENGADFLDIYQFFIEQGNSELDAYQLTVRVFRGSTPQGMPFTKDIAYTKGFVLLYNFLRAAVDSGELNLIPLIFSGKTVLDDIDYLNQLLGKGLLQEPAFMPPQFSDLHGLAAWMCYDSVLSDFSMQPVHHNYTTLMKRPKPKVDQPPSKAFV